MRTRNLFNIIACLLIASSLTPAGASQKAASPSGAAAKSTGVPTARQPAETRPPLIMFRANLASRPIMPLTVAGVSVTESVKTFVDRASISTPSEREHVRALIAQSSENRSVATALASSIFESRTRDFTYTLTALSVLGELRNPVGEAALMKFVALPLPATGHKIDGEIIERITLEKLQMKAVDGLAYAHTPTTDGEVLHIAGMSPSRAVRSEAIAAYMFNHKNSAEARAMLLHIVRPSERVFIDRPSFVPGMSGAAFNAQLALYLKLHPELRAPNPVHTRAAATVIARDRLKGAHAITRRPSLKPPVLTQP